MAEDWLTLLGVVLGVPFSITIVLLILIALSLVGQTPWKNDRDSGSE